MPTSSSGLTIGRGYDMKEKTESQIQKDLIKCGVATKSAKIISKAAGISGAKAKAFIKVRILA